MADLPPLPSYPSVGRPSDYNEDMCGIVIEYGRQGKSLNQMACALGISRETLNQWRKTKPEFSDAIMQALQLSQSWWEDVGQEALYAEKFQSAVYNKQMANRFRHDYEDVTKIKGDADNPLITTIKVTREAVKQMVNEVHDEC